MQRVPKIRDIIRTVETRSNGSETAATDIPITTEARIQKIELVHCEFDPVKDVSGNISQWQKWHLSCVNVFAMGISG